WTCSASRDSGSPLQDHGRDRLAYARCFGALALDVRKRVVDVPDEAVCLGRRTIDARERLVELDRVLAQMLFEAMHAEAEWHHTVPEPRRRIDLAVGDVTELAQYAHVDLREGVADPLDGCTVE